MYRTALALLSVLAIGAWCGNMLFCSAATAEVIEEEHLFNPTRLLTIEIRLAEEDWEQLRRQTRWNGGFAAALGGAEDDPFTTFRADITIDGVEIKSVGIRKKGFFGSLDDVRPSLKIEFDEFVKQDPVEGTDRLTLNNNKQDTSLVSQFLGYKVFNEAGVHAPRCSLAKVTVNGEYLGIYSNVETVRRPFLQARFGDDRGNLFEGAVVDFYDKVLEKFEAKTSERSSDRRKLKQLADLLATEGELPIDELEALVDVDYFLNYWAVESLLGFWDGYTQDQNNFFVYENPRNDKLYFMPWGADVCFTKGGGPFASRRGERSEAVYAEAFLPNRMFRMEGIPERYKQAMLRILDEVWNEEELLAEVDRIDQLTRDHRHPSQVPDGDRPQWGIRYPTTDDVREFIRSRREDIMAELEDWPASIPDTPRKPVYVVDVGTASGSFETRWSEQPNDGTPAGLELTLNLHGEEVTLTETTVGAYPMRFPGFGAGPGGGSGDWTPPAMVVIKGKRTTGNELMTLVLMADAKALAEKADQPIRVTGSLSVGERGGFGFGFPSQTISGTLNLTTVGTKEGDVLSGDFQTQIVEMRGGMMQRR